MQPFSSKIAVFLPGLYDGGAERTMLNLAHGFAARGRNVDLVLAQAEGPNLSHVSDTVRLVDLGAWRSMASLPALVRYLRRERPAVLLSALNRANLIAIWARSLARVPTKIVISERNTLSIDAEHAENWRARLMPALCKQFYPHADAIVAVSQGVAEDLAQVVRNRLQQTHVIYNPVITPALRQKADAPLDHAWFGAGAPVVLAVGRLSEQKDFSTLIRAFAQVRAHLPARLLILGEGTQRPKLDALVRDLHLNDDVNLPGWVDNPYPFMRHAALFVLSSRWEGLPGVLIEALYCGAPLIATDCPSGPREVLADGQYGQLVPVGDVTALAAAMHETLTQPPPPPPRASWQRFEMNAVVDQYLDILSTEEPVKEYVPHGA